MQGQHDEGIGDGMTLLFSERRILIMIAEGKEPHEVASWLQQPLEIAHAQIQRIEEKTGTHTWRGLQNIGQLLKSEEEANMRMYMEKRRKEQES